MRMTHLKRDIMESLKKADEKMDCYSRKTDEKKELNATPERLMKERKLLKKDRGKNE